MFRKIISSVVVLSFFFSYIVPISQVHADTFGLPALGTLVNVSPSYKPVMMKGLKVHADNPLMFDFILDTGNSKLTSEEFKEESHTLIRYFMSALTVPDKELWVNLSPVEKDRIIADGLVKTEMGRNMLAQDYILKQITASLIYPESELGKKFWEKVKQQAFEKFGTRGVEMDSYNKVWIVPQHAMIYENNGAAFVVENQLKVMLEEDYLALNEYIASHPGSTDAQEVLSKTTTNSVSSQIVREIIIPELEKEVNTGKNFAALRQIANAVVLAAWYKKSLKESLLGKVYVGQNKVKGIDLAEKDAKLKIYNQYLESLKAGVYNYIKEEYNTVTKEMLPTKYFSGGTVLNYGEGNTETVQGALGDLTPDVRERVQAGLTAEGRTLAERVELRENQRTVVPVQIPENYADVLKPFGLETKSIEAIPLVGSGNPQEIIDNPQTLTVLRASLAQAIAAIVFAGTGKDGKVAADANAVELTLRTVMEFIKQNPNDAIVVRADEGARDESVSLNMGRIYFQGYEGGHADFGDNQQNYEAELNRLAASGVRLHFFAGDALEKTNGLASTEALTSATDSWALASLADDAPGYRVLVDDNFRIAGTSFSAPTDADVEPFDLPSVAIPKIARARGIDLNSPAYADFVNHLTFVTLGPREAEYSKADTQSGNHRHKAIIDDVLKLKQDFPGLEIRTPGDGDFAPRLVASLGLDLDGRLMITGGRSGSAEATIARLAAALAPNAQFNNRFVSEKSTSTEMILANADQYTPEELARFDQLGYAPGDNSRTNKSSEAPVQGSVAMTSVTGASEWLFGKTFADLMPRVTFNTANATVTTHTLVVTPTGNVYVIRSTFLFKDILAGAKSIIVASPEAQAYVAQNGDGFVNAAMASGVSAPAVDMVEGTQRVELGPKDRDFKVEFGTNGSRAQMFSVDERNQRVADGPFNREFVSRVTAAIGHSLTVQNQAGQLKLKQPEKGVRVLIAYDARKGAQGFAQAAYEAVSAFRGITVDLADGITTSPDAAFMSKDQYDVVVVITASHNPENDNGIKVFTDGIVATDKFAKSIEVRANSSEGRAGYDILPFDASKVNFVSAFDISSARKQRVFSNLLSLVSDYRQANPEAQMVVDMMGGAAARYAPQFEALGIKVFGSEPMSERQYTNRAGKLYSPNPTIAENYGDEFDTFKAGAPDGSIYFGLDGDVDRLVVWVKHEGQAVEVTPNDLGMLYADNLLSDKTKIGSVEGKTLVIAKTLPTSLGLDLIAQKHSVQIFRVPVGSKNFRGLLENPSMIVVVGTEESGHQVVTVRGETFFDDAVTQLFQVLTMMGESRKNPVQLVTELKNEIGFTLNFSNTAVKLSDEIVSAFIAKVKDSPNEIVEAVEKAVGKKAEQVLVISQDNTVEPLVAGAALKPDQGLYFLFRDSKLGAWAWVYFRKSGTEPIIRIYRESSGQNEFLLDLGNQVLGAKAPAPVVAADAFDDANDSSGNPVVNAEIQTVLTEQVPKVVADMNAGYGIADAAQFDSANKFRTLGFDGKANRLGWGVRGLSQINANPEMIRQTFEDAEAIIQKYRFVIFSGMGGSGLSEQLVQTTFGEGRNGVRMYSLRTTDPAVIAAILNDIIAAEAKAGRTITMEDLLKQLKVVVSSKSGTTAETNSHKDHFEKLYAQHGVDKAGHFMLVTDPGSPMETEAKDKAYDLRYIQLNQGTDIGGRFTAPTTNIFLLPLAMVLEKDRVLRMLKTAEEMNTRGIDQDQFLQLASFLYVMQRNSKDKVTFMLPEALRDLGLWAEQLVEESLGKEGKGIKIYYGERLSPAELNDADQSDRVFVRFNLGGVETNPEFAKFLGDHGHPVFDVALNNIDELAGVTLGLQRTVATLANLMDINFVNQPGVEDYKRETKAVLAATPAGEMVQAPADWKSAGYKGQVNVYYSTFLASEVATEEELIAEVARLGGDMTNGAAVYAAMINLSAKNQTTFKAAEIASYGRMTAGFRQVLEDFRFNAFTAGFRVPAKIGEAPDKLHSYQQMVQQGPNDALSLYFMPEVSEQPPGGVTYDINNLRAPAIGSTLALMKAGRKVIFTTFNSSIDDSEGIAKEFFGEVEKFLKAAPTPASSQLGGIDLNPQFFDLQIKRDGKGVALPVYEQSIEGMKIDGFVPVIINVTPIDIAPLLGHKENSDRMAGDLSSKPEVI